MKAGFKLELYVSRKHPAGDILILGDIPQLWKFTADKLKKISEL